MVSVLVVDDHPVVRSGLVALLRGEPWVERTLEAGTAAEALRLATLERPGLAVVDLRLPDADGMSVIRRVIAAHPGCRCAALTMEATPARQSDAVEAGATGFLSKNTDPDLLVDSLHTIARGGVVLTFAGSTGNARGSLPAGLRTLSPREREVALLIGQGHDNRRIAQQTGLADKTVRNVVSNILVKAGVRDRVNLALLVRTHAEGLE